MPYVPTLHYELPRRTAGSFGASTLGRGLEWFTTTWLRFNILVSWVAIALPLLSVPGWPPHSSKLEILLVSPLVAPILYVAIILASWAAYTVPGLNFLFGAGRVFYLWLFSRLIVQPSPNLALPIWLSERSL